MRGFRVHILGHGMGIPCAPQDQFDSTAREIKRHEIQCVTPADPCWDRCPSLVFEQFNIVAMSAFIDGVAQLLRGCHAVLMLERHRMSGPFAVLESIARFKGVCVYHSVDELLQAARALAGEGA